MHEYGITDKNYLRCHGRQSKNAFASFTMRQKDGTATIELLIGRKSERTLRIRVQECVTRISELHFLKKRSTATMRRYYIYFTNCFGKKEWQLLSAKLFPAQTYAAEEPERLLNQITEEPLTGFAES